MPATRIASYLPSIVAVLAVLALSVALDGQTRKLQARDLRAIVTTETELLRTRIESQIDSGLHITRGLGTIIRREGSISQNEFSLITEAVTEGLPEVINVAWAPDLIITHVFPVEGNEKAIGLNYRNVPAQLDAVLHARDTGEVVMVGPVDLIQGGKGFILRLPIYTNQGETIVFKGVLSTVFEMNAFLAKTGLGKTSGEVEFMLSADGTGYDDQTAFFGDPDVANDNPITGKVRVVGGAWTISARPIGGWTNSSIRTQKVVDRALIFLIAALILLPLLVANALAVSRQSKIREMRLSDDRLSSVVTNAPGVFLTFWINDEGDIGIEFITDSCEDLLGLTKEQLYLEPSKLNEMVDPEDLLALRTAVSISHAKLTPWHCIIRITTTDGTRKWIEGRGHPVRLGNGKTRWDNFIVDITSMRNSEEEAQQQAEIARQAQKQESIGQLTGGVAHDFNNMLAVIRGNLEMLHEDLLAEEVADDERIEFIESAITAAERGGDLTKKMLSFARRARLQPELLNINEIVKELEGWTSRTMPATIETNFISGENLPDIRVDRSSTASALLNLIVNARDAMPNGGRLTIETYCEELTAERVAHWEDRVEPGAFVVLSVADTGEGITRELLDHIFDPFFTTKGPGAGSGLGLSMVHGFVKQSGGAIRVDSRAGEGARFRLYFKAQRDSVADVTKPTLAKPVEVQQALRILIAEDEDEVRKVLVTTLRRLGHKVESAPDGDSAFALFRAQPDFDLLLTDMVMPGTLQGTGLARAVHKIDPKFPVIFMSGYASDSATLAANLRPHDQRLTKPVTRSQLIEAIKQALNTTRPPVA